MNAVTHPLPWHGVFAVFGRMAVAMLLCFLALLPIQGAQAAAPAAGTSIGNQASATYTDTANVTRTVTSNVVTAVVQEVAALTLTDTLNKTAAIGGQVVYPFTLTNTGNGENTFTLSPANVGTGVSPFTFTSVTLYADANGDGVADNTTAITSTTPLASGEVFRFVAVANVPTTAVAGGTNALTVTATSTAPGGASAAVTDNTTISANAVVNVTKTMSAVSGAPGTGPYTITLTYSNTGNTPATNVVLTDVLPAGMTYVTDSGRWSVTGAGAAGTALTNGNDGLVPVTGSPQIAYDFGATVVGRVTASISTVAAGQSGTVSFEVTIDPFTAGANNGVAPTGLLAGALNNTAKFAYHDGAASIPAVDTNTFTFTVNQVASITAAGQTVASAAQGSTVTFTNVFRNQGNGIDTFDISLASGTFPVGSSYTLFKADGVSPLLDTNGNGIPDTGPLASGATYNVVLKVTLAADALGGTFSVSKVAKSMVNPAITVTTTDTLSAIVGNTVDLTNDSPGVGAPGAGAYVVGSPAVTTNTVLPGATTRFLLYVNNTTATQGDTFNLAASTDSTFGTMVLPAGWTVVFRDGGEQVITNTGVIAGGGNMLVYADVTVPANQAAIPTPGQSLYFRVLSPSSLAIDRKHDAVIVQTVRSVQLIPNNTGQVSPGGSVVYTHTLTNAGNVTENSGTNTVALSLDNTQIGTFTSVVYLDANNNNVIDPGEVAINSAADLGPLLPGQSKQLLVKVTAVSGAGIGVVNTTTLTATTAGTINTIAFPPVVSATDGTTVISGNLVLLKEQALDTDCDGAIEGSFGTATVSTGAIPGACVRYRITVTNNGTADVTSVVVSDAIPAHTTYHAAVGAATTFGTVLPSSPSANGAVGTVAVNVGTLTPSQSAVITFGVRINPLP